LKSLIAKRQETTPVEILQSENDELRRRLQEAEETVEAIRSGTVDALVVQEAAGNRIYTLAGAERPYRIFVEEMQQGAATLHADGTIAWSNKQLASLLKTPAETLIGISFRDFIASGQHVVYDNLLWQGQTRSGRGESFLRSADGATVPVFLTFNALPKDCGSAIGVLVTDLTSQKHHEQLSEAHAALRVSQRQLGLVTDTAPVFIAYCDRDHRYKFVNERYADRLGLQAKDCIGKHVSEIVGDAAFESVRKYMEIVLSGVPVEFEIELAYPTIGNRFVHCSYAPEADASGSVVGFVAAITDITERKRIEEALRETQAQSERQRRLFEAILANTPDLGYVFDLDHRFIYANEILLKMWGRTWDEAIGKNCLELGYEPWHAAMHDREIEQVKATKRSIRGEVPFTGSFGRRIYDYIFVPVLNGNGEVEAVAGTTRDVTERKQTEEALRESEGRFRQMANNAPVMVWVTEPDGSCSFLSSSWYEFTGQSPSQGLGFGWLDATHPEDRGLAHKTFNLANQKRIPFRLEYRLRRADGEYRWAIDAATPRLGTDGKFLGYIGSIIDITERKETEEALREAQVRLEHHTLELESRVAQRTADLRATNAQLEAFVYSVAHDLRAPLRSMEGFSAMLVEEAGTALSETSRKLANRINRAAHFMDSLLMDLLTFSETSQRQIELTAVNLNAVIESVLSRMENEIHEAKAKVIIAGPCVKLVAHDVTLGQVLVNLLSNALKFVEPGVTPVVNIRVERRTAPHSVPPGGSEPDRWVRVWVEDNGIGIAAEHQDQIFRLFNRLQGNKYPGTGLGLAIVQKGVERMGGRVGLQSKAGSGSRFWFELRQG